MKKLIIISLLISTTYFLSGQIINIPADYPTIQQGINSANNGDTVLVDTGTYFENINFNGKNITVASLFLTTQDTSYILQTVINGTNEDDSSVVAFYNGEDSTALLCGFVIQNGRGTWVGDYPSVRNLGGGIYCFDSSPMFQYLIITNNESYDAGGGIYFEQSQSTLQNVTIKNNSSKYGGGVSIGYQCDLVFDSVKLCSIFANHAAIGNDIYSDQPLEIYLDTFSVMTPTAFYLAPLKNIMLDIQNGILELTDSDLFVSPDGDNSNDGLSEETALKTIHHAFSMILADSSHQNNILLLEGTYSEYNDEVFPIYIPDYVHLKGTNNECVVIKGTFNFTGNLATQLSRVTITEGGSARRGGGINCSNANPILTNILIHDNHVLEQGGGMYVTNNSKVTLVNSTLTNNSAEYSNSDGIYCSGSSLTIINSILWNDTAAEIIFWGNSEDSISVSFTVLHGGEEGVFISDSAVNIFFESNINQYPLFLASGDHPYQINDDSPCIDAGIPDTSGLNLPEFDLAGEVRIFNDRVDMGAYEWNTPGDVDELVAIDISILKIVPNPFYQSTTIKLELKEKRKITLSIYNQLGEKVKTIFEGKKEIGIHQLTWDSENLSSGIYFIKLQTDNGIKTQKMIKK